MQSGLILYHKKNIYLFYILCLYDTTTGTTSVYRISRNMQYNTLYCNIEAGVNKRVTRNGDIKWNHLSVILMALRYFDGMDSFIVVLICFKINTTLIWCLKNYHQTC